jgi:hypothetical protein
MSTSTSSHASAATSSHTPPAGIVVALDGRECAQALARRAVTVRPNDAYLLQDQGAGVSFVFLLDSSTRRMHGVFRFVDVESAPAVVRCVCRLQGWMQ